MSIELITLGLLFLLNLSQLVIHQIDKSRWASRERFLIKAAISDNVQELAASEETPAEMTRRMKVENELAKHAESLTKSQYSAIPIG